MLLVVDIDCTIADGTERVKKAGPEPDRSDKEAYKKWVDTVNTGIENDPIVPGMPQLVKSIYDQCKIVYLTSREEHLRRATKQWLIENKFPQNCPLLMRPNNCWMGGAELKEMAIQLIRQGETEVIVLDDDEHGTIEEMCKRNGFTFLKARSGGQK